MEWIKAERQLVPPLLKASSLISGDGNQQYAIRTESHAGYRIIDIIMAALPETWQNSELGIYRKKFQLLNLQMLMILERIYSHKQITSKKLSKLLYVNDSILINYLSKLEKLELITKATSYSYELTDWFKYAPVEITCIEAKLFRWKEAIEQALYNKRFAERSYIAFPKEIINISTEKNRELRKLGVGLILVNKYGEAEIVINADVNKKKSVEKDIQKIKILKELLSCKKGKWHLTAKASNV